MNPEDLQMISFIDGELSKAKNIRPSIESDSSLEMFWKLTGKIDAFVGIKKYIQNKYLNNYQKARSGHISRNMPKSKPSENVYLEFDDDDLDETIGDF